MTSPLVRRLLAEFIGTAFLLAGVIGSGIMAERLTDDVGLQLLANAGATAGVLYAIILMFGPVSGAHFNPAVTLSDAALTNRPWSDAAFYIVAQVAGGSVGVMVANLMFELDAITMSDKVRDGSGQYIAEVVATFGLIFLIFSLVRTGRESLAAGAVAAYIGGAYWFTSSTSFANPAVSVTRTLSNTFAGIDPASMPMFIVMQLIGATLAVAAIRVIYAND
ncbi:MAG: aquaporin family protein [Acidimicrobiales bacterium]|nr:aquaporin family protein [Acidimicrobiales bacterium]MDG2217455.1 aquaporin family protein [Acidimicrobiales bacterium]